MGTEALSLCVGCDQHLVGRRHDGGTDPKQGAEGGVGRPPAIEAEDEFVEVGSEMALAEAVIDAERPSLEVGEDALI